MGEAIFGGSGGNSDSKIEDTNHFKRSEWERSCRVRETILGYNGVGEYLMARDGDGSAARWRKAWGHPVALTACPPVWPPARL